MSGKTFMLLNPCMLGALLLIGIGLAQENTTCGLEEEMISIEAEVVDLTFAGELFRSSRFRDIYSNPHKNLEMILKTLQCEKLTDTQKQIAAFTMQNLLLNEFLLFGKRLLIMVEGHQISSQLFRIAVFPPYEWNTKLQENFEDESVHAFLAEIKDSAAIPQDLKDYIHEVMTGNALVDIRKLRSAGQLK